MLSKKHLSRQRKFWVGITLLTYLVFPCYQTFGATFSPELDSLFLSDLNIDNEAFLEENKKNWQLIVRQIISSSDRFGNIDLDSYALSLDQSQEDGSDQSLSRQSIAQSFRQLKLGSNLSSDRVGDVPTLPQVSSANVYKGVYDFGSSETESNQPTDTFVFNPSGSAYRGSSERASMGGFSNPGFRSLGALGFAAPATNGSSSGSLVSLTQSQGVKALVSSFSASSFDAQLSMMPQNNISGALSRLNANDTLGSVLGVLGTFGQLKINVDFERLPQMSMPTPLNLKDDFVKTSDLIGRNVQLTSSLQAEVQQRVAKQARDQLDRQRKLQNDQYQRIADLQKRQEELQREQLERQRERQRQQLERYIERQKRLQEKYRQQMEKQFR
jgi:hypothetical protein